ncbi:hypothetical protein BJ508DRAFT_374259 [Ascobolus immersus RN42]|uniref:Uncharacterized protein n=1 Tax=Ascobolus immersus RN42 TaxID=1160509 RepID=A0A3N4IER4_ASCIM|nr:hypothetical protein BJ508DRAFT_374259 [Ascobolus immersus RN42]
MGMSGMWSRECVHDEVGPYTTAAIPLNNSRIRYVLWGSYALHLAFRCPPYWKPELETVDYVIADTDFARAIEVLQKHSYKQQDGVKVGMSGNYVKVGQFSEIAMLSYCGPDVDPEDPELPRPLPVNLIPASLVHFSFEDHRYVTYFDIQLYEESEFNWRVYHATLPGMLDSTLCLLRKNAKQDSDFDHIYSVHRYLSRKSYEQLSSTEVRRDVLWTHAVRTLGCLEEYVSCRHLRARAPPESLANFSEGKKYY